MIPLCHDFTGARVLVFGGGSVGARKARLFDREATVIVVAPQFADRDFGDANRIRAAPEPATVGEWFDRVDPALVVAATDDPALNEAIEDSAHERGVLVNRADHSGERRPGNVAIPAIARDDPVVVGVSTQGRAPTVSVTLRDEIEESLAGAGALATFVGNLRDDLTARDVADRVRHDVLRAVAASDRIRTLLDDDRPDEARAVAERLLAEAQEGDSPEDSGE